MKVEVVGGGWRGNNVYEVELTQGPQSFKLEYMGTKADAEWMAKMFRRALRNHDKEKANAKSRRSV